MGAGIFWTGLNPTDPGCWRFTLKLCRLQIFGNILRKDGCNVSKDMASANSGEGMCNPLIQTT